MKDVEIVNITSGSSIFKSTASQLSLHNATIHLANTSTGIVEALTGSSVSFSKSSILAVNSTAKSALFSATSSSKLEINDTSVFNNTAGSLGTIYLQQSNLTIDSSVV